MAAGTARGARRVLADAIRNDAYAAGLGVPWVAAATAARVRSAALVLAQFDPGGLEWHPDMDTAMDRWER